MLFSTCFFWTKKKVGDPGEKRKKYSKDIASVNPSALSINYYHVLTMGPNHVLLSIHAQLHGFTWQHTYYFLEICFYPLHRQQSRRELIKNMYVYVNDFFYIMYKYLYFKALLWDSGELGSLSGTPTNVLFSKAIIMPAFEDVRVTGCIPTSTTVFPVFLQSAHDTNAWHFCMILGKVGRGEGYWEAEFWQ